MPAPLVIRLWIVLSEHLPIQSGLDRVRRGPVLEAAAGHNEAKFWMNRGASQVLVRREPQTSLCPASESRVKSVAVSITIAAVTDENSAYCDVMFNIWRFLKASSGIYH